MSTFRRELLAAAKDALEILEEYIATADIYGVYLRLKAAIEDEEAVKKNTYTDYKFITDKLDGHTIHFSHDKLDWAGDVLIDTVADSENPNAEKARMITVALATTAFELQAQLDKLAGQGLVITMNWPENPYFESAMATIKSDDDLAEAIPDKEFRTAIAWYLSNRAWELASDAIFEALQDEAGVQIDTPEK